MGCGSSSSSGTEQSIEKVKTKEVRRNPNSATAVNRSQIVKSSKVKTSNNDKTRTPSSDKVKPSAKADDFKLDFNDFKDIDEHARQVFIIIKQRYYLHTVGFTFVHIFKKLKRFQLSHGQSKLTFDD